VHLERVAAVDAPLALPDEPARLRLVALVMAAVRALHEEHDGKKSKEPI